MNRIGKFLLVVSSLSPIMLAYAVNAFSTNNSVAGYSYLTLGIGCGTICLLMLWFCRTQLPVTNLAVVKVKTVDKQALAFLIVYLMPLFTGKAFDFQANPWTAAYVVAIIGLVVYHSNAFTFNPVLALLRYHFYEVEAEDGMSYLLVTRHLLRKQQGSFQVVEIANYVFMDRAVKERKSDV